MPYAPPTQQNSLKVSYPTLTFSENFNIVSPANVIVIQTNLAFVEIGDNI